MMDLNPDQLIEMGLIKPTSLVVRLFNWFNRRVLHRAKNIVTLDRFMAERVPSTTELGRLFMELAEIEWKHKTDLQAEYDASSPPDQFLMDV